jgi:hypothetical protein
MMMRSSKSAGPGSRTSYGMPFHNPSVYDMTEDQMTYGIRPSTSIQCQQLSAINDFNKALPAKKKVKESFPLISSTNVATFPYVRKNKKGVVELFQKYAPIGIEDDFF